MPYQYTNRRGEVYCIQAKQRGGKIGYSAARKPTGAVLDRMPEGYEAYEKPENAQVFVRKIRPSKILAPERTMVEDAIRSLAKVEHFIVEPTADSLIIYSADSEPDRMLDILSEISPMLPDQRQTMRDFLAGRANYTKMFRFMLINDVERTFAAERWCFLGSIDDWYFLAADQPLRALVNKYVPHLGKENFFDLM